MKLLVKICGITNEADAMLAVGLGADALGFVFAPSPRQVSPQVVGRIIERLPREILTVGVFRDESPERMVEIVNGIGLGAAQLHGNESSEATRYVADRVAMTIKAFPAGHPGIRRAVTLGVDMVLVDGASPGSGEVFDWRLAEGVVDPARLIVSGGLHPGNVKDAIAHLRPFGVDVSSGVESGPGRKDPIKLRRFVAASREAEAALAEAGGWEQLDGDESDGTGRQRSFDVGNSDASGRSGHWAGAGSRMTPFDWQSD
ncbi:MAG: phosphoribosylanthranilate isomerase [Acidimicrobiales bacterium]